MSAGSDRPATARTRAPAGTDLRALATTLFRLVLGRPIDEGDRIEWSALLRFAVDERCAGLAWHRSAAAIRRVAPPAIVAQWRATAVAGDLHGAGQLRVLAGTVDALSRAGHEPVVLKGMPLAERLYGAAFVRGSADLDVFVPQTSRGGAEAMLDGLGWEAYEGAAPWTQTRVRTEDGVQHFLELHSALLDVNLSHLGVLAPAAAPIVIAGVELPAHSDALLPAYLASHAAKHMPIALLYHFDFLTLWSSLSVAERDHATSAGTRAGLLGYLEWAIHNASLVERAADGDMDALGQLGIGATGRKAYHAVFRDIVLAQTPLDAGRAVAAWLWPPPLRGGIGPLARRWATRVRKPWLDYVIPSRRRQPGRRV
jgi:hypothetical protein